MLHIKLFFVEGLSNFSLSSIKTVQLSVAYPVREYDLTASVLDNHQATGSFAAKDNRTEEETELDRLRKENQRLLIENDILKQAALIMGRK